MTRSPWMNKVSWTQKYDRSANWTPTGVVDNKEQEMIVNMDFPGNTRHQPNSRSMPVHRLRRCPTLSQQWANVSGFLGIPRNSV